MFNLFRFVGLRHLRMKPVRSILTTLGVAFGVALYIAIEIINRSTLVAFRENVDAVAGKATLSISAGETGFPEGLVEKIQKVPGVKHAAPMIESRAYFAGNKDGSETLMVMGVDLLKEQSVRTYKTADEQVIDDPLIFLNQPDSIILTHSFADQHGLKMDSKFSLATAHGVKQFTVRGLLSPEGPAKAYGGGIALMDIDGAQLTFGKEGKLDRVDIVTAPDADIEKVATDLRAALGAAFQVERPETQSQDMERLVKTYQAMLGLFSTLALLVGVFLVTNSVSIAVAERRREIGTLRALGAPRKGILSLFLAEALAIGSLGSMTGVWFGRVLSHWLVARVTYAMSSQFVMKMEVPRLEYHSSEFLHACVIGAIVSVAAALLPALRATLIQPLEAMRKNEVAARDRNLLVRLTPAFGALMLTYYALSSTFHWSDTFHWADWLDQGCAMIGSALVGPTIVVALIRLVSPFMIPLGGAIARLADDNLLRNPQRTGSNVISLMVGLLLVIMIATVNVSSKQTILDWFGRVFQSDLLVSSAGRVISFQSQPLHEDLGKEIAAVPGVHSGPERGAYGMRFIHFNYGGRTLGMKAYDEPDPRFKFSTIQVHGRSAIDAGRDLFHSQDPTILVSNNFVLHFGKRTGDSIQITTPSGLVSFRIVGVMDDFASAEGVVYIDRRNYKKFWNDPLVNVFAINLEKGVKIDDVRREIDRRFGSSRNLISISNQEFRKQMNDVVDRSFGYTDAISMAALLVGLMGLFNTFLISVMERTRELGMLRAVGMSRTQMRSMILTEALVQGSFGALAATALGTLISYLWIQGTFAHVLGWIVTFHFPWTGVVTTVVTGVIVALVAGAFPAYRAANLEIREALEYE
jgi:putative ABC transport system permease protein